MFSAVGSAFVKSSRALVGATTVRTIKVVSGFEVFGFETFPISCPNYVMFHVASFIIFNWRQTGNDRREYDDVWGHFYKLPSNYHFDEPVLHVIRTLHWV